jgi:hypothetical protein
MPIPKGLSPEDIVSYVMREYYHGNLTSHGELVTDEQQAKAIAMREAGLSRRPKKMARMTTTRMMTRLQKQAHNAELKALSAKHRVVVQKVREGLHDAHADLKERMKREESQLKDAIPRARRPRKVSATKVAKKTRKTKRNSDETVRALLARAARK